MGGSVIFYTYGSTLELNGQQLTAGMLTADLLNLSPDEYMRLKKRMTQITNLAEEYERKRDIALWWKLNEKMDALCQKLRRYQVFRLLLDEDEDAFFSAIREITEQFSVFPTEDQAPTAEAQKRQLERVANQFSQRGEDTPLDLFHPSEADLEDGMAFYYEMLRAFGPTRGAWRDYQKRLDRYALYLHDIRAFNETIQNLSGSAYPSWNTTVRRSMRRRSTVSTMMIVSRKSSSSIPSATMATAIRLTMPTSFPMCRGHCQTALSPSVRST